jgi:hypothetical protein
MSDFLARLKAAASHLQPGKVGGVMHRANTKLGKWTASIRDQAKRLFPKAGRD